MIIAPPWPQFGLAGYPGCRADPARSFGRPDGWPGSGGRRRQPCKAWTTPGPPKTSFQLLLADGKICVVRVREEISLQETLVPYEQKTEPNPNVALDQTQVTYQGQYGVEVTCERARRRWAGGQPGA